MLGVHAVCQRVFAPSAGKGGSRRIFALVQIVVEERKMRRRDDLDHFGPGIKRGIRAVVLGTRRRDQLPGSDQRNGRFWGGVYVAGGKNGR